MKLQHKSFKYKITSIIISDLDEISQLTPTGWNGVTEHIKNYIDWEFASPIKVQYGKEIIAIGCAIFYESTAWLAHIIVKENYRKQGIGSIVVKYLIQICLKRQISTISLVASEMGEPLYSKLGFRKISSYIFLQGNSSIITTFNKNIHKADKTEFEDILTFDQQVTGENRIRILTKYSDEIYIYKGEERLEGAFMSCLGEGLIIASSQEAGTALMDVALQTKTSFVLPEENKCGINHLRSKGFIQTLNASRMIWGDDINVKLNLIYNRIGGNLG